MSLSPPSSQTIHHRALLKTHHITSRTKLSAVIHSAARLSLALVLKTGRPPGILIAEGLERDALKEWVKDVKKLRYKNCQMLRIEAIDPRQAGRLFPGPYGTGAGIMREFTAMEDLSRFLGEGRVLEWWRRGMGFVHGHA